jgi:hypothetical protein
VSRLSIDFLNLQGFDPARLSNPDEADLFANKMEGLAQSD